MLDDSPEVCDEMELGNVKAFRIFGGMRKSQRHNRFKPVYRNFTAAIQDVIAEYESGTIPLRHRDDMVYRAGRDVIERR